MADLVSVVIPVYNGEATIKNCLESIFRQTYKNFEILVVNDGSNDSTESILDAMRRVEPRLKVYSQPNKGVEAARNLALDMASGHYIFFCDSDDEFHPKMIEQMMQAASVTSADIIFCGLIYSKESGEYRDTLPKSHLVTTNDFMKCIFSLKGAGKIGQTGGYVPNKCFKKELIGKHRFERVGVGEDEHFLFRVLENVKTVWFEDQYLYKYNLRDNSLSSNVDFLHSLMMARFASFQNAYSAESLVISRFATLEALVWDFDYLRQCDLLSLDKLKDINRVARTLFSFRVFTNYSAFTGNRTLLILITCLLPIRCIKGILKIKGYLKIK